MCEQQGEISKGVSKLYIPFRINPSQYQFPLIMRRPIHPREPNVAPSSRPPISVCIALLTSLA